MPTGPVRLSIVEARRLAVRAQGLARTRPSTTVTRRHLHQVFDTVGAVQIDAVTAVARSHDLVLHARLGAHSGSLLNDAAQAGETFEYWGHEASHLPVALHPLLRWRMEAARRGEAWTNVVEAARKDPRFVSAVRDAVAERGASTAGELSELLRPRQRPKGAWWDWDDTKSVLEYLFWTGEVTARRRTDFTRVYDLTERAIPADVLASRTPQPDKAHSELLLRAARAMGVATAADLADYFRLKVATCAPLLQKLVRTKKLVLADVDGWREPAYLDPEAPEPRPTKARALIAPFDSLIWFRPRVERLFAMSYRVEIYTPAPQRRFGYYVMPFLLGDQLVGRVDLKAERSTGVLKVLLAHREPTAPPAADLIEPLHAELVDLARWLGLERLQVTQKGELAKGLAVTAR